MRYNYLFVLCSLLHYLVGEAKPTQVPRSSIFLFVFSCVYNMDNDLKAKSEQHISPYIVFLFTTCVQF